MRRLTFGSIPGLIQQVKKMGIEASIQSQLQPISLAIPDGLTAQLQSLDSLSLTPGQLDKQQQPLNEKAKKLKLNSTTTRKIRGDFQQTIRKQTEQGGLMRADESPRPREEVRVDFWYNQFNVNGLQGEQIKLFFSSYEQQAIRPDVLGKFEALLGAIVKHPAMLLDLENWHTAPGSSKAKGKFKGLNENSARELLKLHTLGVYWGSTQADIMDLARIFTGWGVPESSAKRRIEDENGFDFEADRQDFEDQVFLGHQIKSRGVEEAEEALGILACHPATALQISDKLLQSFVADNPPDS
ncbi:MAG: DUF1800 family protein [Lyngbya sp.]|nr:DUF1800 family protein [Lyngbya sp.]